MEDLKPCPFCGKSDAMEISTMQECEDCKNFENQDLCPAFDPNERTDNCPFKAVICSIYKGGCGASSGFRVSIEDAVRAWNMRCTAHENIQRDPE
jgi:hypothetical protein